MSSLRRQLWLWLLPAFIVAAVIAALSTYYSYGRTVHWFMDSHVRALVESQVTADGMRSRQPLTAYEIAMKGGVAMHVWSVDGQLLATNFPALDVQPQPRTGFVDMAANEQRWRVYTLRKSDRIVQGAQSSKFREHVIRGQAVQSGLPILLLIPVAGLLLWLAIRQAVRRLEIVADAAAARNEHHLEELPVAPAPTEIRPLVDAINRLLARLADAFQVQRRFVQDAAHELRTPLTALSLQLENVKAQATDAQLKSQLETLETGIARMKRVTTQLLRLARQEAAYLPIQNASVAPADLLREIVSELLPLAERRGVDISLQSSSMPAIRGTPEDVRSLLHNLIDNAIRYSPADGDVAISAIRSDEALEVHIADDGPGIPEELLPRVFDRFFRIEGTNVEGSGLGLAIAKRAAERVGAVLTLHNRSDRDGLVASVRFATVAGQRVHARAQTEAA